MLTPPTWWAIHEPHRKLELYVLTLRPLKLPLQPLLVVLLIVAFLVFLQTPSSPSAFQLVHVLGLQVIALAKSKGLKRCPASWWMLSPYIGQVQRVRDRSAYHALDVRVVLEYNLAGCFPFTHSDVRTSGRTKELRCVDMGFLARSLTKVLAPDLYCPIPSHVINDSRLVAVHDRPRHFEKTWHWTVGCQIADIHSQGWRLP
mmetsp:Transcript_89837/g.172161  ORF Transcript_89837/g.172161 Transcript_89837/m.172161 type:complete len:202 (+) Transcript_89837:420-1025(+)